MNLVVTLNLQQYNGKSQEYPTKPLDKIPARQAEFELAGKKNIG